MHLLIIGGTLFVGRHIVEAALQAGHRVTLFHRGQTGSQLFPQVERLIGDRDGDLSSLAGRRFDAVIDTCAYTPAQVEAAVQALVPANIAHYLLISSVAAHRDFASHRPYDETAPLDPGLEGYGGLKARCEDRLNALLPGHCTIVRPGLVVGPHDPTGRFTYWPQRLAQGGDVLAPGRPQRPVQWIDARDLAAFCVHAAQAGLRGAYNVVGPNLPMADLLAACQAAAACASRLHWFDDARLLEAGFQPWTELPLWLPEDDPLQGGMLLGRSDRAQAAGLRCRPVETTVRDTLQWCRQITARGEAVPSSTATLDAQRESHWLASQDATARATS